MKNETLAYLAGAMDSDGWFSIKKSDYKTRVIKDCYYPTYQAKVGLKQVTPQIPNLLHSIFRGSLRKEKGQSENSKELFVFECNNQQAIAFCKTLLPFLVVKKQQAKIILELEETRNRKYLMHSYWFSQKYPNWKNDELLSSQEVCHILGYKNLSSVSQAVKNGLLLSVKGAYHLASKPRIPKKLVEIVLEEQRKGKDGRVRTSPQEVVEWRERLYKQVRELNKIGIHGTEVYFRTGYHTRKDGAI